MKLCLFLLICFCHFSLQANFDDFQIYQNQFTKDELVIRIKTFLQKQPGVENHYVLTDETFYLFANQEDKNRHHPEFTLKLSSSPQQRKSRSIPRSLKDLRIAIDPGHLGGDFAILEERYIKMFKTKPKEAKESIFFKEGTLALLTALLLKEWLEAEGANVLLTKEHDGQAVYEKTFFEWLAVEGYKHPLPFNTLFSRYYNRLDLHARVRKINQFKPHLTLIIHYNAHGGRDPVTQENLPQKFNYNMVFIGGSFCNGELATVESRHEFLRLLLTDDIDHSLELSKHVIENFTKYLRVPPVSQQDLVPYLEKSSLQVENGVYARNLALTRLVRGPLCYGESLCQDHESECIRLNSKEFELNHMQGPYRVVQVAKAYYAAVKAFIERRE